MNIYEKLQKCRVELQQAGIKKSGENTFSNYDYFELSDFLPKTNELFMQNKLCGIVTFDKENATLTIIDTEKPEDKIIFISPMADATLKGCHPIQNAGAVQTYQRRYLYIAAMEVSEPDIIDKTNDKNETKPSGNASNNQKQDKSAKNNSAQPPELEKRATAIYYHYCGNKEGQCNLSKDEYNVMLKEWKEQGQISDVYGKRWTLKDIEFIEQQIAEEGDLPF